MSSTSWHKDAPEAVGGETAKGIAVARYCARLLVCVLLTSSTAGALDPDRLLSQMNHRSWTSNQGAPGAIEDLAQTSDGFLWIGTSGLGLFRFDGVRFEAFDSPAGELPSRDVSALRSSPDSGGLWVGYRTGGVSFIKQGVIRNYTQREGMPSATVRDVVFGKRGETWALTARGVMRLDHDRWQAIGPDWGLPLYPLNYIYVDQQNSTWVLTNDAVFRLSEGANRFTIAYQRPTASDSTLKANGLASITQTSDGRLWILDTIRESIFPTTMDAAGMLKEDIERAPSGVSVPEGSSWASTTARDGALWVMSGNALSRLISPDGILRHVSGPKGKIDRFSAGDGLSDATIQGFLEDTEGNIWVSTTRGLDQFSRRNVVPMAIPKNDSAGWNALASDADGSLWLGRKTDAGPSIVAKVMGSVVSSFPIPARVSCAYRDPSGVLWFGGQDMLLRLVDGRWEHLVPPVPLGDPHPLTEIQALSSDGSGGLWASVAQHGVFLRHNDVWIPYGSQRELPQATALTLWTDSHKRTWFGYTENRLAMFDGRRVQMFSFAEGLAIGNVTAIVGADKIWAGGADGLALFDGSRFRMIADWAHDKIGGVTGIVQTPNGDLWLSQAAGVVHIQAAAIEAKLADPQSALSYERFDDRDGVLGAGEPLRPHPTALLGNDGKIWFSSIQGVSWIDPNRLYKNPIPPPLSIRQILADGKVFESDSVVKLPPLVANVQINYTAPSFTIPERVRFRYKLDGFDKEWQDVGARRSAFYNNIRPGRYDFHVIAANSDGVWNLTGASLSLIVPPAFYQTTLFRAALAALGLMIVWMLYRLRLRQIDRQFDARLEARVTERTRIARELHDTLLQSFHGLMLRFQAAKNLLPGRPEEADHALQMAIDRAALAITEGRDAVQSLRSSTLPGHDLIGALSMLAEELRIAHSALPGAAGVPEFNAVVEGSPLSLRPLVRDDVYRIAAEALTNAFRHSRAKTVEVELRYDHRTLRVRIRDDGIGLDPAVLSQGGRTEHWGLPGMRERAKIIGGDIEVWSEQERGTEIELSVPGSLAYERFTPDTDQLQ